ANIPIDYICGTSMGSMVAALYALYNDTEKTVTIAREVFLENPTPKSDLNLIPKYSFYKGKRINEIIDPHCKEVDIEDLWLPFFTISSNITNPGMNVITKGPTKTALLATTAVPGLFPPVIIDNEIHVDGGLFSNVPIDVMMQENIGTLIACRVNKEIPEGTEEVVKVTGLLTTFMKSIMVYSDSYSDHLQQYADLYFEPQTNKFGMLAWKSADELIKIGYEHAKEVLQDIDIKTINKQL
ncbi:patatin-like phospholipase family protein, partial [Saprospiraceae bacterium]|nr:patatin-like phospholipase family protein [Saprospiraceae bacterium]